MLQLVIVGRCRRRAGQEQTVAARRYVVKVQSHDLPQPPLHPVAPRGIAHVASGGEGKTGDRRRFRRLDGHEQDDQRMLPPAALSDAGHIGRASKAMAGRQHVKSDTVRLNQDQPPPWRFTER